MGIYYVTKFYPNINNKNIFFTLGNINAFLTESDMFCGYINANDIFVFTNGKITAEDITEQSYVVEYIVTTYENPPSLEEHRRIPVFRNCPEGQHS
jgi:hypothetical protein